MNNRDMKFAIGYSLQPIVKAIVYALLVYALWTRKLGGFKYFEALGIIYESSLKVPNAADPLVEAPLVFQLDEILKCSYQFTKT